MYRVYVFKTYNNGIQCIKCTCENINDASTILTTLCLSYKTVFASVILDKQKIFIKHTGSIISIKNLLKKHL